MMPSTSKHCNLIADKNKGKTSLPENNPGKTRPPAMKTMTDFIEKGGID
jgi:hypothetical protein